MRNDWDYPALREFQEPVKVPTKSHSNDRQETVAGFKFHTPTHNDRLKDPNAAGLDFEPLQWRERACSSASDTEVEVEEESAAGSATSRSSTSQKSPKKDLKNEEIDSVGADFKHRRMARKRKRQKALEEEMTWNAGLAHWMARRDDWCGAHTTKQVQDLETKKQSADEERSVGSTGASTGSTPRTSTSSTSPNSPRSSVPTSQSSGTPETSPQTTAVLKPVPVSPFEVLVPVAPPILQDHPIRRTITAARYPDIYSKIILQSRTPSVPINLQTMVNALIKGWKDDGEWPPKPAPLEKSIRKKKGSNESGLKHGVKAVGRVLRITSNDHGEKEKG